MLTQVADGVLVHQSEFMKSNGVVVQGLTGVLLIDPGTDSESAASRTTLTTWANPLWQAFPRIRIGITCSGTPDSARRLVSVRPAARSLSARAVGPGFQDRVADLMPPDIADHVPLDLLGHITGLPAESHRFPGTALRSGSSSIRRMPRGMRRC